MPIAVLRSAFSSLFAGGNCADAIEVVWHAGEPTSAPIAYYREAMAVIASLVPDGTKLTHTFQTNATLLDDAWCDFIIEAGIVLGVSIDGPQHVHDAYRLRRNGNGTFDEVMRGISLLKSRAIEFFCIAVVTDKSVDAPDEMFEFFESLAPQHVCFLVEHVQGTNASSSLDRGDAKQRFTQFLVRYADLITATRSRQVVREIERMAAKIVLSANQPVGSQLVEPFEILTIDHRGDLFTFCPELVASRHPVFGSLAIGNVLSGGIAQARGSEKLRRMHAEIAAGVAKCRDSCGYFEICGGGAPSLKLSEHGRFDVAETQGCRIYYQAVADAVLQRFARDAAAALEVGQ
jgi:uncharacterized protein